MKIRFTILKEYGKTFKLQTQHNKNREAFLINLTLSSEVKFIQS